VNNHSYLTHLSCSNCTTDYPADCCQTFCYKCKSPLLAQYDLHSAKNHLDRDSFSARKKGMWRWYEFLPVYNPGNIISLGEGDTPIINLTSISEELGLSRLYLKEEALNPTGSFKARGMSAAVSKAKELGIQKIVLPSAGNAGGALAAYAARAHLETLIYMPEKTPESNITESKLMGARVELVDGLIDVAGMRAEEQSTKNNWFNMSTFKEPYRVEGKKILGYEIAEYLDWFLPDVILYPTGGGTGLVGMWKAFKELLNLGWLESESLPRMIAVQAKGCAPVVKAFLSGASTCSFWENAHTIASGLCVPKSFADRIILQILSESNGTAITVSDEEIIQSRSQLAQKEGINACPEGAATLAALKILLKQGNIEPKETVILFNTASGLKYPSL
jgi:threonine synthase